MTEALPGLTAERLRDVLSYSKTTGKFTWLVHRRSIGKVAGTIDSNGYVLIRIDGRLYRACRLAWLYVKGEWPTQQVDHANLDKADDSWLNLRDATNSQNSMNKPMPKLNTSGFKGVSWSKRKRKWLAYIKVRGKQMGLGEFNDRENAHKAYLAAAENLHGEFARAA